MLLMIRAATWTLGLLLKIVQPIYWYRGRIPPKRLPPLKNPLLQLSAVRLAEKIRNRQVSSESVVAAYIERIKSVNPLINAVVDERYKEALEEAKDCDKTLESQKITPEELMKTKPLFGVPITVKESCSLKGLSCTGCSLVKQGIKASEDSYVVSCMKEAGAIPLCVTNTPEVCSGFESTNLLYGTTVNPYDVRHSAGGSSGGEGALLGAGASLLGLGSDLAGSIRVPAMFNGVFGHKPTPGIISIRGHFPMSDDEKFKKFLVLGPLARYADDLHLAVKVLSAKCNDNLRLDEPIDITKLNIYYKDNVSSGFGLIPTDRDVRSTIHRAVEHFESLGVNITQPIIGDLEDTLELCIAGLFSVESLPPILMHPTNPKEKVNSTLEMAKSLVGCSQYSRNAVIMSVLNDLNGLIWPSDVPKCISKLEVLKSKLLECLGDNGVFLYPTYTSSAPPIGRIPLEISSAMYCLLCNILGLPSTQIPMGLNANGLPIGFQVFAAPKQDRLCLAIAKELEKAFGGWVPPPSN